MKQALEDLKKLRMKLAANDAKISRLTKIKKNAMNPERIQDEIYRLEDLNFDIDIDIAKLETEISVLSLQEQPPSRSNKRKNMSPDEKEGASIGLPQLALPQVEQMNLFGVGDIFR